MTTDITFESLPLAAPIQKTLQKQDYTTPSPIQAQAIPVILDGHDILASAQTGTGKTAAFALPVLHRLYNDIRPYTPKQARVLVLAPTRELAEQIDKSFYKYGKGLGLRYTRIFGGVKMSPQIRAMSGGVDVLVATPGRLLDLHRQKKVDFRGVEYLILDEADRMLDMGFIHDIRTIVAEIPKQRQTLFFSATFNKTVTGLAESLLNDPVEIRIAPDVSTAERVDQHICFVKKEDKLELLKSLLDHAEEQPGRNLTLVFSRTKHGADKLAKQINQYGVPTDAIHGDKTQAARTRALESFRKGKSQVLVATDVAARGIDVKDITLVINYDLPDEPEAYVHRIGRTARAEAEGVAVTFCTPDTMKELRAVERWIKQEIPCFSDHPFHQEAIEKKRNQRPQGKRPTHVNRRGRKPQGKQSGYRGQGKRPQGKRPQGRKQAAGRK